MPKPAKSTKPMANVSDALVARKHRQYMDGCALQLPLTSASTPAPTPTDGSNNSNNTTNTFSFAMSENNTLTGITLKEAFSLL